MKAANILFSARGLIVGALSRLDDAVARLEVLQKVSDDASSGVAPLQGLSESNAEALSQCLSREVDQARAVAEQLRSGYALLQACASSMPPPHPNAVDLTCGGEIWIELEA
jgi:hypothetical protein